MIMQVVPEARQQRDGLFFAVAGHMALLQRKGNVARRVCIERAHQSRELSRRLFAVVDRGCCAHCALSLDKLLQEHPGQRSVRNVVEVHLEDHHDLGARRHDEHRLGLSVFDGHAGQVGALVGQECIEGTVEWTAQQVPLEFTDGVKELCGVTGQVVAVELQRVIVVLRGTHLETRKQSVQHRLRTQPVSGKRKVILKSIFTQANIFCGIVDI